MVASRREGYDDPWRYYPGYDSSFDDEGRRRDPYADDFDRRSVHSEQSAHSVHSSHSRRSSFSSRSQQVCVDLIVPVYVSVCLWMWMCITNFFFIQSQVYRSQPDLVSAAYDATGTTLPADYTYSQYPNPSDTVDYSQIPYSTDNTWTAPEQRKYYTKHNVHHNVALNVGIFFWATAFSVFIINFPQNTTHFSGLLIDTMFF